MDKLTAVTQTPHDTIYKGLPLTDWMAMRYPSTLDTGLQETQILEWSDLTTLTLLTRRLAGERNTQM